MIIMRLFGGEGVMATVAYIGFTIVIGSVGYEARHVSYRSVVTISRFWFFEEEEVYVMLAFIVGERYSMVKASSVFPGSTAYRFIAVSGFCSSKKRNLFWGHWKVETADLQ